MTELTNMLRLRRSQIQPIGIDIGQDSVKMLQLEVVGQSVAAHAACRRELPTEDRTSNAPAAVPTAPPAQKNIRSWDAAAGLIRQMLRTGGFSGCNAVVALPPEIVHVKNFRLPPMPPAEMESAVQLEARHLFSFDNDETQVQCLPAGEVRQGDDVLQEVIVLAARNDEVNSFVEQMHRCGLIVASLDAEACALFRSVERFIRRREDEAEVHVMVNVGRSGTQVVIGKGREISFIKDLDLGGNHLHQAIACKLGISADEAAALRWRLVDSAPSGDAPDALAPAKVRQAVADATRIVMEQLGREISLCLRYQSVTFRGHRPTRLRKHATRSFSRCFPRSSLSLSSRAGLYTTSILRG